MRARVSCSRSVTPAGFSTVVKFHENEIRSRQKLAVANIPAARSTSRSRRADSKSTNQPSTSSCGVGEVPVSGSMVWVMPRSFACSFAYAV